MTNLTVEDLARAIMDEQWGSLDVPPGASELAAARAILARIQETHAIVLREPSEAMVDAGWAIYGDPPGPPGPPDQVWQAMLSASPPIGDGE